jgi:segregation and condensation protein B
MGMLNEENHEDTLSGDDAERETIGPDGADDGLSLDQLSEAYAQLIDGGIDPYRRPTPPPESSSIAELLEDEEPEHDLDVDPLTILESIMFVGTEDNTPLASQDIAKLMRGVRPNEVDELIVELNQRYDESTRPFHIASIGAGYRMILREQFDALREKFYGRVREARLSQTAVDVLSIVAYKQPIKKNEVEGFLGKPSAGVLSQLVRRELLLVERSETKPVVVSYRTTDRFLDLFGLENLSELPRSQDLDRTV